MTKRKEKTRSVGERFRKQFAGTKIGAMTSIVVGGAGGQAMAMKGKGAKKGGKKGGKKGAEKKTE